MNPEQIRQHAEQHGIASDYQDAHGNTISVDEEVLLKLLCNMGVVRDGATTASNRDTGALPPAIVVRAERGRIAIDLPETVPAGTVDWLVILENGKRRSGETRVAGARQMILSDIPYGYHQLVLENLNVRTTLIVTPGRCWLPEKTARGGRSFGISLQLYLLRSARNWGIGDFGDLAKFAEFSAAHGCDVLGLNPLHQMFADNPEHASPYSPASRHCLNVLYIDVLAIPESLHAQSARALIETPAFSDRLARCRSASQVDYASVSRLKLEVLRLLHAEFRAHASRSRISDFELFVSNGGGSLQNASLFQALRDHFAADNPAQAEWQRWPDTFRSAGSPDVLRFALDHRDDVDFYNWLQWIADRQLAEASASAMGAGMQIGLYRDLAVGCDRTGAETWTSPANYIAATDVGAPPDIFNPSGQNWGLPPLNPVALAREGYRPFIELIQSNMRHAGGLRIDHVMGLQRLYCIPAGLPASRGTFINYPLEELLGILALESHRNKCLVVGEDLGTVPAGFRERMAEANILSYRVLFFEHDEDGALHAPQNYPRLSVAVAGNHDLPTLRGWLKASDIDLKHRLGLYPSAEQTVAQGAMRQKQHAEVLRRLDLPGDPQQISPAAFSTAVHRFLSRTESVLALAQLDDLLDEHDQVNMPATSTEHPNWRRRYSEPIEALQHDHPAWRLLAILGASRSAAEDHAGSGARLAQALQPALGTGR